MQVINKTLLNKDVSELTPEEIQLIQDTVRTVFQRVPRIYSYEGILERALSNISDDLDKRQSSPVYDGVAPAAGEIAQGYIELEIYKDQTSLLYAVDGNLDNIGYQWGVTRKKAVTAERIMETINTNDAPFNLPVGSRFSVPDEEPPLYFYIKKYLETGKCVIACEQKGSIGNNYFGALLPLFGITNLKSSQIIGNYIVGSDIESDDDYRQRILDKIISKAFAGNIDAYEEMCLDIAGVGLCKVYPAWAGGGTVKLSLLDTDFNPITEEFAGFLKELIDPEDYEGSGIGLAPINHRVTIDTPDEKAIDITAHIEIKQDIDIEQIRPLIEAELGKYIQSLRKDFKGAKFSVVSIVKITIARVIEAILQVESITNVASSQVIINGINEDFEIESNANSQFIPKLGEVTLYAI